MAIDLFLWLNEKFLQPMCNYYTLEATLVYGLLLVAAVFGTYKLLKKLKIKINRQFALALLPFILFGGSARALRDHGFFQGYLFCSPLIYFVVFAITLASLLAAILIQKKFRFQYHKSMFAAGALLLLYNISMISISNWFGFSVIIGLTTFWAILFFGLHRLFPKKLSFANSGIMVSHLLDASSTFTALTFFGYYEQHVLPNFLINIFGPWVMFPLKIFVVLPVLLLIDKYGEDKQFTNFLKIIILILGLALGTRDFLTVSMRAFN